MTKQTVYLPADGKSCDFIVRWYDDSYENDVKREEGYFFTPEQLNEDRANVIKQALETAAEKVEHEEYKFDGKQPQISKQSITNTFEETFQKYKV